MKIAFLSRYQNELQRGAENFVSELSTQLARNCDVQILSGKDADDIWKVIKDRYDVVIPINGRLQSLKASFGRLIGGYKLLITGHSGVGRDDIWNILVKPDVFVTLSEYQKEWAKKWTWGSTVTKIPNGVDLEKFNPVGNKIKLGLERPIILSVGALVWYKYQERIVHALARIPKGSLLIIGDGPDKQKLQNLGQKLLGKRFKIANFIYQDMPKVYRSCDLFTLPSWSREAFGIVYLEAMASGLGIVAPDDSPRREFIGDAGLFVDVTDTEKYAAVIEKVLENDWSKKARKQAEKFSWDKISKEYEKLIFYLTYGN